MRLFFAGKYMQNNWRLNCTMNESVKLCWRRRTMSCCSFISAQFFFTLFVLDSDTKKKRIWTVSAFTGSPCGTAEIFFWLFFLVSVFLFFCLLLTAKPMGHTYLLVEHVQHLCRFTHWTVQVISVCLYVCYLQPNKYSLFILIDKARAKARAKDETYIYECRWLGDCFNFFFSNHFFLTKRPLPTFCQAQPVSQFMSEVVRLFATE